MCSPRTTTGFLDAEKAAGRWGLQPHTPRAPAEVGFQQLDFSPLTFLFMQSSHDELTCAKLNFLFLFFFLYFLCVLIESRHLKTTETISGQKTLRCVWDPTPPSPRPPSQRRTLLVDSSSHAFPGLTLLYYCFCTKLLASQGQGQHITNSKPGEQLFVVLEGYLIEQVSWLEFVLLDMSSLHKVIKTTNKDHGVDFCLGSTLETLSHSQYRYYKYHTHLK